MSGVWIVEREHWPRACLRAELIERGHDAVGFETVNDLLVALATPRPRPAAVVLVLEGLALTPHALGVLERTGIPLVAVAGAVEAAAPLVRGRRWAALLRRPVSLGAVVGAVKRVLAAAQTSSTTWAR
jgi:hypothetical protein